MRLPGASARWYTTTDVLSWPVGCGDAVARDDHEAGLVAVVVLDVGGEHLEPVELRRRAADRSRRSPRASAPRPSALPRRSSSPPRARRPAVSALRNAWHCAVATGIDTTRLISSSRVPAGASRQSWTSSTTSRWISRSWSKASASMRDVDDALDRVLDRHEAEVDLARFGRVEHVGDRRDRHQLALREVGLGEQRLLGERAERPEEPDAVRGRSRRRSR